jgi:UDP-glucuronate 4-epimerase
MRALVTGAAGFIGSSLVDRLLSDGHDVVGIDSYTNYYSRDTKEKNLSRARDYSNFRLFEKDLCRDDVSPLFDGVTDVFHLAGQPGVRKSWGIDFDDYLSWNVLATQRLLEIVKINESLQSFVFASSSSVYGNQPKFPSSELDLPQPVSPYGVTKLASEHMCCLYAKQFNVPTVSLRYFTVYGPRQRPDMGISKMINALIDEKDFKIYGDGNQLRDFTYIDDVVEANLYAATYAQANTPRGAIFNVGGNGTVSINELIGMIEEISGLEMRKIYSDAMAGDPRTTCADAQKIKQETGWVPSIPIRIGLANQFNWTKIGKPYD